MHIKINLILFKHSACIQHQAGTNKEGLLIESREGLKDKPTLISKLHTSKHTIKLIYKRSGCQLQQLTNILP